MKTNSLSSGLTDYWQFEKPGDSIYGKYIGSFTGKKNEVLKLKTSMGVIGINKYSCLNGVHEQMEIGKFYLFTFDGYGKSDKGDYYMVKVSNPVPESEEDKNQLRSWYDNCTFYLETEKSKNNNQNKNESNSNSDKEEPGLPF